MNIPLSRLILIIVIAAGIYLLYQFVWAGKSHEDLITTWNNFVFRSSDESTSGNTVEAEPDPTDAWVK